MTELTSEASMKFNKINIREIQAAQFTDDHLKVIINKIKSDPESLKNQFILDQNVLYKIDDNHSLNDKGIKLCLPKNKIK